MRGDTLAGLVGQLTHTGLVRIWSHGFGDHDGHPRYVVSGGMNALARHLAEGLDVRVGIEVREIGPGPSGWRLAGDDTILEAEAVVLTAPVPQSLLVLAAGGTVLDADLAAGLAAIEYDRVLAVLAVLDGTSAVPAPGGIQLSDGPFTFVADNAAKGVSAVPALTAHTTDEVARARWDDDPDTVLADLLAVAAPWIGTARVAAAQLKRWRYAAPRRTWPDACCVAATRPGPLVLAGDAFDGPRVEGAVDSGVAAADAVIAAAG